MIKQRLISALAPGLGLMAFFSFGPTAFAQQVPAPSPDVLSYPAAASHYSREAVQSLSRHGISLHCAYVNDLSKSPFSTRGDHDWFARYSFDLLMDIDGQKAMQLKGVAFHLDLKRHAIVSGQLSGEVTQGYSNIDADSKMYLYEVWAQQSFAQDHLEVQLGQIDANSKFATVATAADFLNSSMGYSPTIMNFPTYPEPKFGIDLLANLPGSYRVTAGGFQTAGGKITLAEAGKKWTTGSRGVTGDVELGYWKLRQPLFTRDGEQISGTHGYYAVVEQGIWNAQKGGDLVSAKNLIAFLQLGVGDARENCFKSHVGFGMVLQSPFSRRHADSIGIAATRVQTAGQNAAMDAEFVSEGYYKLTVKSGVALVVDAQFFENPVASAHYPPFFVLTPRLAFTF